MLDSWVVAQRPMGCSGLHSACRPRIAGVIGLYAAVVGLLTMLVSAILIGELSASVVVDVMVASWQFTPPAMVVVNSSCLAWR